MGNNRDGLGRKPNKLAKQIGERIKKVKDLQYPAETYEDLAEIVGVGRHNWRRLHSYVRGLALAPKDVLDKLALHWRIDEGSEFFTKPVETPAYDGMIAITLTPDGESVRIVTRVLAYTTSMPDGCFVRTSQEAVVLEPGDSAANVRMVTIGQEDTTMSPRVSPLDRLRVIASSKALPSTLVIIKDKVSGLEYLRSYEPSRSPLVFHAPNGRDFAESQASIVGIVAEREFEVAAGWTVSEKSRMGLPSVNTWMSPPMMKDVDKIPLKT